MRFNVGTLVIKYMERLGIEAIFGMPGAHILPVYDALYDSDIQSILAKHEQGAAFMAGGYARASNTISACIATAGPGATNLITGVANAYADRLPILVITGETSTHIFGKGGLQESSGEGGSIDQVLLFKSITKYSKTVERTDYLAQVLNQASTILLSPTPGPVLLSFPFNVQKEMVDDSILDNIKTKRRVHRVQENLPAVESLSRHIIDANSPVIIAGYGCIKSGAQEIVSRLSELMNIPVATSLKGKGIIEEHATLSLGSLGVTSNGNAYRYIVEKADLLIFLGAGFNERTSYLWDEKLLRDKKVVQIDNDNDQLEKVFEAEVAIHGDIKEILSGVLKNIDKRECCKKSIKEIEANIEKLEKYSQTGESSVSQAEFSLAEGFFKRLEKNFPEEIFVFDDNIIFAQNFFNVSKGNHYFPNSGISSLGHAIPAAIGARFSRRIPTFAILGDGGFQMCCMEIMTAVNYSIPLNIVIFNNSTMGLIRKNQFQQYNKRFINCDFINPDYQHLARSFGINHKTIKTESDITDLFENSDLADSINLIEIIIDKNAFPTYMSKR
ncbi:MAG: thiamine pyrophosphate-binding protein [gamma proteobacterium endosymbiont of Lamellibrachia anaximandri]|nr:thiamine pyrophosphate-binding protein [gamma proteobacterium endosymbiont of Lamellibrachia anaximandri]MBL3535730.1 thiamine pyrophosphate-binding protein [gamma proteobacterium endosymbiont of Lamellibrachia anaximandri]